MKAFEIIQGDDGQFSCGPENEAAEMGGAVPNAGGRGGPVEGGENEAQEHAGLQPVKDLGAALEAANAYFTAQGEQQPTAEQDLAAGFKAGQGQQAGFGPQ